MMFHHTNATPSSGQSRAAMLENHTGVRRQCSGHASCSGWQLLIGFDVWRMPESTFSGGNDKIVAASPWWRVFDRNLKAAQEGIGQILEIEGGFEIAFYLALKNSNRGG